MKERFLDKFKACFYFHSLGYCTIFDFEGDKSLMQWNKSGTAFDNQPTFLDNLYARTGRAAKHEGVRWIGSRENRAHAYETPGATQGNGPIGTLTSPGFIISASKLYFLLAGTADKTKARVELLIEGLVARTAFSKTGNDSLVPMSWDVEKLLGRQAQIRIVDSGSDAFVSFDGLKSNCHPSEGWFQQDKILFNFLVSGYFSARSFCGLN